MSDESAGALIDPQRWQAEFPEPIFEGLSEWIRGQAFDMALLRRHEEGGSGSYVAAVMVHHDEGPIRGAILKILPPDLAQTESRGVQRAAASGPPGFVEAHLAGTVAVSVLPGPSGAWVHVQEVATDGAASMQPLSAFADDKGFGDHCAKILTALSQDWNPGANDPRPLAVTPADYLRQDLASRTAGLAAFAAAAGWSPEAPPPMVTLPGRSAPLANPLALLGARPPRGEQVLVFLGRGHGDLHPDNIMIPVIQKRAAADRFRLIDLGRFSNRMEISRDPAKLLLSVVAGWLGNHGSDAPLRADLARLVADPAGYEPSPATAGYARIARAMHDAAATWAVKRQLVREWERQHRLVVAAAALRTVSRQELPENDRWWHLEVAAQALAPLLPPPEVRAAEPPAPPPSSVFSTAPIPAPAVLADAPDDDLHRLANLLREALLAKDHRKLVILVGAGVTSTRVPSVARLTRLAFDFADQRGSTKLRADPIDALPDRPGVQQVLIARYSEALQFVHEVRGPDALQAFLQQVTLQARTSDRPKELSSEPLTDDQYADLENQALTWRPPESLTLLAKMLRTHGRNVHPFLLTTNFDPLTEVALRQAKLSTGPSHAVTGPNHSMDALRKGGVRWTVVHLHGTPYRGSLHYPTQIAQPHPGVEEWLASLMSGNRVLVLGYSGWDGLIQRTMRRHFGRRTEEKSDQSTDVLWAVYEPREQHAHVDPALADFLERNNRQGVTAFYGIDSDRLMRTLSEELNGRRAHAATRPTFYSTVKTLSVSYQFGHSHIRPETEPGFVFWPHRLRSPHLIHGVHALTAALLSKRNVPIELHLDDTEMTGPYADDRAEEFTDAVVGWFEKCGAAEPPKIFRIRRLIDELPENERAMRLWRLASDLFHPEVTALDALLATKVVSADRDQTTVAPTGAERLLRPLYTWLALDDAMARHRKEGEDGATVVTLGGIDEQKMWDLWRARRGASSVASLFVPRLETPASPWTISALERYHPFGRSDLGPQLVRWAGAWETGSSLLEWVFTAACRLAAFASDGAVPPLRASDGTTMSWPVASMQLRRQPEATCHEIAEIVAAWFYHDATDIR